MESQEFQVQAMFKGTILSHGYGFIAQKIMRDKNITYPAKAIYSYLASFSGVKMECFPSVDLMQAELGMPEKTFYKHLRILKDKGLVTTERIRSINSKFKGTLYSLIINEREIEEIVHTRELMGMDKDNKKSHTHEFNGVESNGVESNGVESTVLKVPDLKVIDLKYSTTPSTDSGNGKMINIFEREFGRLLTEMECQKVSKFYDEIGEDLTIEVLREAIETGVRTFKYMNSIVTEWQKKGIKSLSDLEEERRKFKQSQEKKKQSYGLPKNTQVQEKPKEPNKYDKFYL